MLFLVKNTTLCYHAYNQKSRRRSISMSKKIIILNGSPRPNGNTSSLTAAFRKGAEEAGRMEKHRESIMRKRGAAGGH